MQARAAGRHVQQRTRAHARGGVLQRLAFVGLWLFTFVIPWEDTVRLAGLGTISRPIGYAALGLAFLAVFARTGFRRLDPVHYLIIAFVGWSILTFYWSVDPAATQSRILTFVQLFVMTLLVWEVARDRLGLMRLMVAYVLGAYVSAIWTIVNFFSGRQLSYAARYAASGFDPNTLGLILALGIPTAWYCGLVGGRGISGWICRIYPAAALFAIILTGSRAATLAASVALLIVPATLRWLRPWGKVTAGILVIVLIQFGVPRVPSESWRRLATISEQFSGGDFNSRTQIWEAGMQVFYDAPFIGVGAGAFPAAVERYLGAQWDAHNVFLAISVGHGSVGLLIFLSILLVCGIYVARHLTSLEKILWLVTGLSWLIGASTLTWEHRKPMWLFIALIVGHAAVARAGREAASRTFRRERSSSRSVTRGEACGTAQSTAPGSLTEPVRDGG